MACASRPHAEHPSKTELRGLVAGEGEVACRTDIATFADRRGTGRIGAAVEAVRVSWGKYLVARLGDERWDYAVYYCSWTITSLLILHWLAVILGMCSPLLGFSRFGLSLPLSCAVPLVSVGLMNCRLEFDLLTMQDGTSRVSDVLFVSMAVVFNALYVFVVFDEILPDIVALVGAGRMLSDRVHAVPSGAGLDFGNVSRTCPGRPARQRLNAACWASSPEPAAALACGAHAQVDDELAHRTGMSRSAERRFGEM